MPTATLTSKGQITLPRAVRALWGLAPGDRVDFVIDAESGRVELRPLAARAREAFGMLYRADRPARSIEELDAARDAALAEDDARIRRAWQAGEMGEDAHLADEDEDEDSGDGDRSGSRSDANPDPLP